MRLYVCNDFLKNVTFAPRPGGHPCGVALKALREAGYDPEVQAVGGVALPLLDRTSGRAKVEQLTGQRVVPVLELDDGDVIRDSKRIVIWAHSHPAGAPAA